MGKLGVPISGAQTSTSCQMSGGMRSEIKCIINIIHLNQHETIPPTPGSGKKLFSMKSVPGTKKVGDLWAKREEFSPWGQIMAQWSRGWAPGLGRWGLNSRSAPWGWDFGPGSKSLRAPVSHHEIRAGDYENQGCMQCARVWGLAEGEHSMYTNCRSSS